MTPSFNFCVEYHIVATSGRELHKILKDIVSKPMPSNKGVKTTYFMFWRRTQGIHGIKPLRAQHILAVAALLVWCNPDHVCQYGIVL